MQNPEGLTQIVAAARHDGVDAISFFAIRMVPLGSIIWIWDAQKPVR